MWWVVSFFSGNLSDVGQTDDSVSNDVSKQNESQIQVNWSRNIRVGSMSEQELIDELIDDLTKLSIDFMPEQVIQCCPYCGKPDDD